MVPPILLVAVGGALGGLLRVVIGEAAGATAPGGAPWVQLLVNVAGALAAGVLVSRTDPESSARSLLVTGGLGGFTSFSAASVSVVDFGEAGRAGTGLAYLALTVVGCVVAAALGRVAGSAYR